MYAKLYRSLYQGTLRGNKDQILVFTYLIAQADVDGWADIHFKVIADDTGCTVEEVKEAIKGLEAPDPESRSRELNGARLERMDEDRDWGWRIVNYSKYRNMKTAEQIREENRIRQQRYRDKKKQNVTPVTLRNAPSQNVTPGHKKSRYIDVDVKEDIKKREKRKATTLSEKFIPPTSDEVIQYAKDRDFNSDPLKFFAHHKSKGWVVGRNSMKDWKAAFVYWELNEKKGIKQ